MASIWDVVVAIAAPLNTALILGAYFMPRTGKGTQGNKNVAVEIPQWFKDIPMTEIEGKGVMAWLEEYPADNLGELIISVLRAGGALFISTTRDRGALGLTIMFGDDKKRLYASTPMELDIILQKVS